MPAAPAHWPAQHPVRLDTPTLEPASRHRRGRVGALGRYVNGIGRLDQLDLPTTRTPCQRHRRAVERSSTALWRTIGHRPERGGARCGWCIGIQNSYMYM
eukprot:228718-Prymnesium_polylepis.1